MNRILFFIAISISNILLAQSPNWAKDDRHNLFEDCMNYSTKYKNLSNDQKESLCLCYLEETTKKYAKSDFEAKIEIELKRIKEALLTQCAKNIGVELTMASKETLVKDEPKELPKTEQIKGVITKAILTGKWKTDNMSTIEFREDGSYFEKRTDNQITPNKGYIVDGIIKVTGF